MQFGLGTVLVLTTALCATLGIWSYYVQPYRLTARLTDRILELGGRYASKPAQGPEWQRALVEKMLGPGSFCELESVDLVFGWITHEDVALIGQMRKVRTLNLDRAGLDDDGALRLAGMPQLAEFSARYTQVTDRGASALVCAPMLQTIHLTGCRISDRTLDAIPTGASLKQVFARWSDVTEAGVERNVRRVGCQVHWTEPSRQDG
jgi:hypothetical protein